MTKTISNFKNKWASVDALAKSSKLAGFRASSRDLVEKQTYPTRRDEEWKYTNITTLASEEFSGVESFKSAEDVTSPYLDEDFYNLVFVNGAVTSGMLESLGKVSGLSVLSIEQAYEEHGDFLSKLDEELSTKFDNPFLGLNTSMLCDGVYLGVEEKAVIEKPIKITHITTECSAAATIQPRVVIRGGKLSDVSVVEHFVATERTSSNKILTNVVANIKLEQGARVNHTKVVTEACDITHVSSTRVLLDRDSVFNDMNACLKGGLVRQDLNVILNGENAEANLHGVYVGSGNDHFDNHLNIIHRKPNARSRQVYKGAMGDESRGVFNGKIIVERYAQQTDAGQINKNLLLSDRAEIDTKPELWVDADDVKAAHGATVAQLDENEIFYFQTRGIDRSRAEAILARGFVEEVLYKETNETIKAFVDSELVKSFPELG